MTLQERVAFASAGAVRKRPEMTLDMAVTVVRNPAAYAPRDVLRAAIWVYGSNDASPADILAAANLI